MTQIGILEPTDFSPKALETLRSIGEVACFKGDDRRTFLKDKEVVFVRLSHRVDAQFLGEAAKLVVLVSPTTGVTHIDFDAIIARRISVLTLRDQVDFLRGITASSEHCLGMIIGILRNYPRAILGHGNIHWDRDSVRGHDVKDLDIGLIGFGRIGRWLTGVLTVMGARVCYFDPAPADSDAHFQVRRCKGIAELIDQSSLVVVAASYVPGSPPILNAALIDRLKGKYLVNISRGELVDEVYLLRRLREGWFAGVALDVLSAEPRPIKDLADLLRAADQQNFMLTPHIGGATYESSYRTEEFMVAQLLDFLNDRGLEE